MLDIKESIEDDSRRDAIARHASLLFLPPPNAA